MTDSTTERRSSLSERLNPGLERALNERHSHLLPDMAEGVVDFAHDC